MSEDAITADGVTPENPASPVMAEGAAVVPDSPVENQVTADAAVAAKPAAGTSSAGPAQPRRPWWQRAWAIFGAVVGIVGAITGVIGILPLLFRDVTTPESLTVAVESADAELAPVFAVPIDTDWSSFPAAVGSCTQEQLAWLDGAGRRLAERYLVSVGNAASEGAMLSLKDFRGEGQGASTPAQAVAVICDQTGSGGSALRAARVDPASGRTAVYAQADPSLPDNPLVFNLAPGESGDFALLVQSSADFDGELVFTASLGSKTWTVTLPVNGGVSASGVAAQRFTVVDGRLACVGPDPCDPDQVLTELLVASGRV